MPEQLDFAKFTKEEVSQIIGPGSDSRRAYEMSKFEPAKYAAIKQAACYSYGLIAESMIPVKSRISKQDLEAKRRADLAAQKDELIEVPPAVCDRIGLQYGTKLSYENFTKAVMGRQTAQ